MHIVHFNKQGSHTDTIEKFYTDENTAKDNQSNDMHTLQPDKIFEAMLQGEGQMM